MGVELASYFDKAQEMGGLAAKIKLAMLTKLSRNMAMEAPDSPENRIVFREAMTELAAQLSA